MQWKKQKAMQLCHTLELRMNRLLQNGRLRAVSILAFFLHEIYVQYRPENYQCGGREGEGVMVGPAERVAEK